MAKQLAMKMEKSTTKDGSKAILEESRSKQIQLEKVRLVVNCIVSQVVVVFGTY
jgi:hypothetical protein